MTSNRPLLPGGTLSRAQQWRRWLLHSLAGRALMVAVAIKATANLIGFIAPSTWTVLDAVDAVGSLGLLFVGGYAIARGIAWAKRRLLWRVRRKLILSYVFVGLVPGLLIISFFLFAAFLLFFNVSTYLLQTRVRTLVDQTRFMAQSTALEAEHGDTTDVLRRRLEQRLGIAAESYPYTSLAIVPVQGLECPDAAGAAVTTPRPMTIGPWQHLDAPTGLPPWIRCEGFAGLLAYEAVGGTVVEDRLLMRAVAVPDTKSPEWAVIVDLPFSPVVEERLREETGIRLGEVSALPFQDTRVTNPRGRLLSVRPPAAEATTTFGEGWVAFLDVRHWETGAA
ncbi:MAG: hypothetical protein H0T71_15855, partial [Acidobacteria bacterium]|nr:hypothetical protein [Acidobacteriota bacterium]